MRWMQRFRRPTRKIAQLSKQVLQLYKQGQYQQAITLAKQALELTRDALGETHPDYANCLNNLAMLHQATGNYAAAQPLCQQAIRLSRQVLGESHPEMASALNNLARLYQAMGNYAAAAPLFQRALAIREEALGPPHPATASSLHNLAELYAATDRETEALTLMEKAATIDDRMIAEVFSIGSESHRLAYLKTVERNLDRFLSLVSQNLVGLPEATGVALDLVLRRKGIGPEVLAAQRDAVLGGTSQSTAARTRREKSSPHLPLKLATYLLGLLTELNYPFAFPLGIPRIPLRHFLYQCPLRHGLSLLPSALRPIISLLPLEDHTNCACERPSTPRNSLRFNT